MAELLATGEAPAPEGDIQEAIPEAPANPVTQPGDVWVIGSHRLICGDCRDRSVVERLMGGALVNVCITSPPYAKQRDYDPRAASDRSRQRSMPPGIATWRRTSRRSLRTTAPTS